MKISVRLPYRECASPRWCFVYPYLCRRCIHIVRAEIQVNKTAMYLQYFCSVYQLQVDNTEAGKRNKNIVNALNSGTFLGFVSGKYVPYINSFIFCIFVGAHYSNVTMGAMPSQNTSLTIVYSTVYSGADQRKHQSSASLAFVRGIHRWPVNSPHKWPVTRKMFPFDDVIISTRCLFISS